MQASSAPPSPPWSPRRLHLSINSAFGKESVSKMSGMNTACRHQCWLQECPQETDLPICLRTDESPSPVKRPKLHGTWRPPPLRRSAEMAQLEPPSRSPPVASPGELSPAPLPHHWECHPTCRGDPCRHGPGGANRTPDESPELTCSHGQESVCPWKDETQGVRPLRAGCEAGGAVCPLVGARRQSWGQSDEGKP